MNFDPDPKSLIPGKPSMRRVAQNARSVMRRAWAFRPSAEGLEARQVLSVGPVSPSVAEQFFLEELNDARFNPAAYGDSLGLNLSQIAPAQPLAMNSAWVQVARAYDLRVLSRYSTGIASPASQSNTSGSKVVSTIPAEDFSGFDYSLSQPLPPYVDAASTAYILATLIQDPGFPNLDHRVHLLDIGGKLHSYRQIGIGIESKDVPDPTYSLESHLTETSMYILKTSNTNPFITGVVFNDLNQDGEYGVGEGLGGVHITVAGAGSTTSLDSGGYSLQLKPGVYTVTASGGGLPAPIARTVVLGANNVRLNFDANPNGTTLNAVAGKAVAGSLGSVVPFQPGDTPSSYSARIDWGDGHDSYANLVPNARGSFDVTGGNTYKTAGVYAVRVQITHLSDGSSFVLDSTMIVSKSSIKAKLIRR